MIKRYRFGDPIETEAVLRKPEPEQETVPYYIEPEEDKTGFTCRLEPEDIVYGLGEQVRGINKRGWIYVSYCSDNPDHQEDTRSLYGAHNFLIVSGKRSFGLFIDTPERVTFDVGYTDSDRMKVTADSANYELYLIEGKTPEEIVKEFRGLVGRSYLPPKWAFGYGQSRWSYRTSAEVRHVAETFREKQIPLDMIYLDIDYMERYKDFTIDREHFPDFEALVEEMKAKKIHLVPIIDGGVKVEEGYDVYEEGVKNNYFCKDQEGNDFTLGVWPGKCHYPDMLNEDARRWFGRKYQFLLEKGIDGFWNDMNEPAIFYSEKHLKEVFEQIGDYRGQNLDIRSYFEFCALVSGISNNEEDYRSFSHTYRGERIRHDRVHNLFGYYMTRSAAEAFEELEPGKRILLFSRASYIGMHRYGGIWMGDNKSWWSHLKMNLQMLPSLNMCGFLYTGADVGGFGSDATRDLLLRWTALGVFMPLFRNHSADGTRRQEPYAFGEETEAFRGLIGLRYRLLPYIYSEFMKAALQDGMYARPLGFVWPDDPRARRVEDQLLIGESIMIAPVCEQNADGRTVYLPERMKLLRFRGMELTEERELDPGDHFIRTALDEVTVYLRDGHALPLSAGGMNVEDTDWTHLQVLRYGDGASYELYDDDGLDPYVKLEGRLKKI